MQVQLEDMVYTAESSGNFWNFDPTRMVINDSVGVCVEGNPPDAARDCAPVVNDPNWFFEPKSDGFRALAY